MFCSLLTDCYGNDDGVDEVILVVIRQVSWKDRMCTSADVNGCDDGQNQEHNKYNTAEDNGQDEAHCK